MSIPNRPQPRPAAKRTRRRLPRVAMGLAAVAASGAGVVVAFGTSAAFAGTSGQQIALVNPASDNVTFNISGYNQYQQYTTQSVTADGGQTVYDYNWWWQDALNVQEVDNTTGQQTSFQIDVPAVQSGSDWYTVTGSEAATLSLSSSPSPGVATQPITLQAAVSPSAQAAQVAPGQAATGTVTFHQLILSTGADTILGSATVSNGAAQLTTSSLAAGTDYWWASYSGDSVNLAATTTLSVVTVAAANPSVVFSANPVRFYNVVLGKTASQTLTLTNNGNIPWTGYSASTNSAQFNFAGGTCFSHGYLPPGASCTWVATYTPSAVGQQKGVITVADSFAAPATLNLQGTGVAQPSITSISPKSGPAAGGTKVTITGTNLAGLTSAHVGTAQAKSLSCSSLTSCTLVTPAGTGTLDITVTDAAGTSLKTTADRFTY